MADRRPKKITLCLMLKNEHAVIRRLLDSAKPIIQTISITDTGSTDNTLALVEDWSRDNNIPCVAFNEPWINFGVSRTKSLLNAKLAFPDTDYFLLLDADMTLCIEKEFNSSSLIDGNYLVKQHNVNTEYFNTRLISARYNFRSLSATHEYWGCPELVKIGKIKSLIIHDLNDGGSRYDKIERDKRLLLEGLRKGSTPDYLIGRYLFYLAQSYQGSCEYELSNKLFERRFDLGGWVEENYYCLYRIAENYFRMKDFESSVKYCMKAWNYRSSRAEPVILAAQCYICLNMIAVAINFIKISREIPMTTDILFVEAECYNGKEADKLLDEITKKGVK